jgi:outer membrane protein OmpA-like peptidoglycan-associated protein
MRRRASEPYNFWPVYSDLALSAILVLMLFLLTQHVVNSRLIIQQDISRLEVRELQDNVQARLSAMPGIIGTTTDGNTQIITLSGDFLFQPDETTLTPRGTELLTNISALLLANDTLFTRIVVEGHADIENSRNFYREGDVVGDHGNWRLSAERAIRVVQQFQRGGIAGRKLEVSGRSEYDPSDLTFRHFTGRAQPDTISAYRQSLQNNRRIVIKLFYSEAEERP